MRPVWARAMLVLAIALVARGERAAAYGRWDSPQLPARDAPSQPRIGTAVLSGAVVTNDANPQPIRRARITLNGDIRIEGQVATSDDAGRFVFRGIPPGRYMLQAIKAPFVPMNYGATRLERPGTAVAVSEGQTITGLVIRMTRGAAIEGRVLDQSGEPMAGALVAVMRSGYSPITGGRALTTVANVVADDRGIYRAFGLAPGEYVVVARPPIAPDAGRGGGSGPDTRRLTTADVDRILQAAQAPATAPPRAMPGSAVNWSPVYHPGTPDLASAARLTLAAGEDQSGIDIPMRLVPTSRISGIVTTPDGVLPQTVLITIVPADPRARLSTNLGFVSSARPPAAGRYTFAGVTPGSFIVNARTGSGAGRGAAAPTTATPVLWASAPVTVQGVDLDVPLALQPAIAVSGRVEFKTQTPPTPEEIAGLRILLRSVESGPDEAYQPSARVTEPGTFAFAGGVPGLFRLNWSRGAGREWFMTSATVGGRETLDGPVEIKAPIADMTVVFTDRPSEISGTLQDATGRPATDYFIVVFSTNRAYWTPLSRRVMQTRPGTDGSYLLRNLPAGEYLVAALTDVAPGDASDPAFLGELTASAVKVTVSDGARTVQAFRIPGGR
jgi:hypothetical protein